MLSLKAHLRFLTDSVRPIAFLAFRSRHTLLEKGIIIFDKYTSNDGNQYNPRTGHFTCPKTGVYIYTFHLSLGSRGLGCLKKEGQILDPGQDDRQTESYLVVECQKGERIWVECNGRQMSYNPVRITDHVYEPKMLGSPSCIFSGHFLGTQ